MELISVAERKALLSGYKHEALHVELKDDYGIDSELFAAWQAGDPDGVLARAIADWVASVRAATTGGRVRRRIRVVSEPLSEYQRFAVAESLPPVEAGEDIRWVPRRLVSTIALPGNDFWLLDRETVIFNVFAGTGERAEIQLWREPEVAELCSQAWDAVWALAIPHRKYRQRTG